MLISKALPYGLSQPQVKLTVRLLQDEGLEFEGDSLCKAINISLGIRDTPDPIHDIAGVEDDVLDARHNIADVENNTPEFFEDPNSDAENDILVPDFGDIVFAEELGTVSISLNTSAKF